MISAFNFSFNPQTMHSIMHALPHVCMQAVAGVGLEEGAAVVSETVETFAEPVKEAKELADEEELADDSDIEEGRDRSRKEDDE